MTGEYGNGLSVRCYPTDDPMVWQTQQRAACINKPYENCHSCRHSSFRIYFDPQLVTLRLQKQKIQVKCPQWDNEELRKQGLTPDYYTNVELSTCGARPFAFCIFCPSYQDLEDRGIDKKQEWFTRWKKYG